VPVGLYARRILPDGITDSDVVVPQLLTAGGVFSPGTAAFIMLGMVAAAMSSLDSVLLVTASTADRDIVRVVRPRPVSERTVMKATRLYVALFAAITAVIALNPPGGIVALTSLSGGMFGACFAPAILLGLYWRRGNGGSVLASFAVGLSVLLIWKRLPVAASLHEVFPAILLSFLAYVVVAWLTPVRNQVGVDALFDGSQAARQ
jgi:Na+/pantothenate symporter